MSGTNWLLNSVEENFEKLYFQQDKQIQLSRQKYYFRVLDQVLSALRSIPGYRFVWKELRFLSDYYHR